MIKRIVALLLVAVLGSCVLVARPSDLVYKPYCYHTHPDAMYCRDGHYGDLWRCWYHGRWRCFRVPQTQVPQVP